MMEAAGTSETLVNFYQTTRLYNPEDSHLLPKKTLFAPLKTHRIRCSLFNPGVSVCDGVSSHILAEHDTSHGASEEEVEHTQQADS
jgi:hypothetical protein